MAQISTLPVAAPVYTAMDTKIFTQSVKNIACKAMFKSTKYEILQDKVRRLDLYANQLENIFREKLPSLQSVISNADSGDAFAPLKEIDEALADPSLDKDSLQALRDERAHLIADMARDLSAVAKQVADVASALDAKLGEIGEVVIAERVDGALEMERGRRVDALATITAKELERKGVTDDRAKIIAAQDIIRSRNIVDMFKDYIPSETELKNIDLSKPEVTAVMLSVELVRKVLNNVSEGVKYSQLADVRKTFDARYDVLTGLIDAAQAQVVASDAVLGDLTAVASVDQDRQPLMTEAAKFSNACAAFVVALRGQAAQELSPPALDKLLGLFSDYLGNTAHSFSKNVLS
jgi:hypothetical protein